MVVGKNTKIHFLPLERLDFLRCELFTFPFYFIFRQFRSISNKFFMASGDVQDESLYPIAVLIDELRNEDVQVRFFLFIVHIINIKSFVNLISFHLVTIE